MNRTLPAEGLQRALAIRDLSDPEQGSHAMQNIVYAAHEALARAWRCPRLIHRGSPVVRVADNYDSLGYAPGAVARDARYTRYVSTDYLLRSHTSAAVPALLRAVALDPPDDVLLVCPGLVYRRDTIDRLHTGEPHQLDLWRVRRGWLTEADLLEMIATVVRATLPGRRWRATPASHPYTCDGLQVDVEVDGDWIEIGECGLAGPHVLAHAGLDTSVLTGLAMGLGLDRMLMIRKGIDDIRLLRSPDPRIARQMLDLEPYAAVSNQPAMRRDLSIAVEAAAQPEELGDRIREAMEERVEMLESIEIVSEESYDDLPAGARERMGMVPGQKNVLLRLVIRHPTRTLTGEEANEIRDRVYRAVHEGRRLELAV